MFSILDVIVSTEYCDDVGLYDVCSMCLMMICTMSMFWFYFLFVVVAVACVVCIQAVVVGVVLRFGACININIENERGYDLFCG